MTGVSNLSEEDERNLDELGEAMNKDEREGLLALRFAIQRDLLAMTRKVDSVLCRIDAKI